MNLAGKDSLSMNLILGVVQGRLTRSPPGQLQWFPQDDWEEEFPVAKGLGLSYIEYIAEREFNAENPIWTADGINRIKVLNQENGMQAEALCNDFIIDHFLGDADVIRQNLELLEITARLGCKKYILPLFEASELTSSNLPKFKGALNEIVNQAYDQGILVCLETILKGDDLVEVLNTLNQSSVTVVFDTGNRVAFGHDLGSDIRKLAGHINHIHIKDKNFNNENVLVGTGLVDFYEVFLALRDISYTGSFTFETSRGFDPVRTMQHNIEFISFFNQEAFRS
jgi:sugar phosphate isomerase/epimerase